MSESQGFSSYIGLRDSGFPIWTCADDTFAEVWYTNQGLPLCLGKESRHQSHRRSVFLNAGFRFKDILHMLRGRWSCVSGCYCICSLLIPVDYNRGLKISDCPPPLAPTGRIRPLRKSF